MPNKLEQHIIEHKILGVTSGGGGGSSASYSTISGNTGSANTLVADATIQIIGSNGITTVAANGSPDSLTIDGSNLLPLDGSRSMTANLNLGGFSISNVNTVDGRDVSVDGSTLDAHVIDTSIHFAQSGIDHFNLQNIGSNSHSTIDSHISDGTIHWSYLTSGILSHDLLSGLSDDDHVQYIRTDGTRVFTGSQSLGNNALTSVGYLDFDLLANPAHLEGRLRWNDDDKTLRVDTDVNNVDISLGQMTYLRVRNISGSTILKGKAVYISGASGQRPTIALAANNDLPTCKAAIGLVVADINNNSNGYVVTHGLLKDTNTNAWNVADQLWLSNTPGELTSTRPASPLHAVRFGTVVSQNATTGIIFVQLDLGAHINELHDTLLTALGDNDILQYNTSNSLWENQTTSGIATTLDHGFLQGLSDDDHSQYALLAGRGSSQTLNGGTTVSGILNLSSTSNGTKGQIFFGSNSVFNETTNRLGIGTISPAMEIDVVGNVRSTASFNSYNVTDTTALIGLNIQTDTAAVDFLASGSTAAGTLAGYPVADSVRLRTASAVSPTNFIFGTGGATPLRIITANVERMTFLSNGSIGIKNSTPSSTYTLDINGQISITESAGSGGVVTRNIGDGANSFSVVSSSDAVLNLRWHSSAYSGLSKVFRLRLGGTDTPLGFMISFFDTTPVFTAKSTGIGILTTSPVNALDVEGAVAIGAAYSGTSTAPTNGLIVEGNVGIGTASVSANTKVDITRSDSSTVIAGLEVANDSTGDAFIRTTLGTSRAYSLGIDNSDGDKFKIGTAANATSGVHTGTILTIDPATNYVGIGTTTPGLPLHVSGSSTGAAYLDRSTSSTNVEYQPLNIRTISTGDMVDNHGVGIAFSIMDNALVQNVIGQVNCIRDGADNSGAMKFSTLNAGVFTEKMRITPSGNVHITERLSTLTSTDLIFARNATDIAKVTVSGIEPVSNITYDLGSPSYRWRELYVGSGSVDIGGISRISAAGDYAALSTGLKLSNSTSTTAGVIRWSGTQFEGYNGSAWKKLDASSTDVDHGTTTGLGDDDHAQYLLVTGTRALGGNWSLGSFNLTSAGQFHFTNGAKLSSPADGQLLVTDNAGSGSPRLLFGGTTSAFPMLKRVGTAIHAQFADDSNAALLVADGFRSTFNYFSMDGSSQGALSLANNIPIYWSSTTNYSAAKDLGLTRESAGILRVSNGSTGLGSLISSTHYGATAASGTLTLASTTNATKGKILFGSSAYDEVNNRLGIGGASPSYPLEISGGTESIVLRTTGTGTGGSWKGRIVAGGATNVFVMGEYSDMAWLGGHSSSLAAWADFYINPDGTKKLFLGAQGGYSDGPIMTLDNNGSNIGVGIVSPSSSAKIDVTLSNTSSTLAGLELAQDSTGDAFMRWALGTSAAYSLGIDNSDSDKFKLGYSATTTAGVDTGTLLAVDTAGTLSITSRLNTLSATNLIFSRNGTDIAQITTSGIEPTTSGVYDLGSPSMPWRSVYVTGSSLNIGGIVSLGAAADYATLSKGLKLGNSTTTTAGVIRWNNTNFEGYDGSAWRRLDLEVPTSAAGWTEDTGNNRIRLITSTRRVGIGIADANYRLHIKDTSATILMSVGNDSGDAGTSNAILRIATNQTSGNYAGLSLAREGNMGGYITAINNGINISGTADGATPGIFHGLAGGVVGYTGIGTVGPSYKLDVQQAASGTLIRARTTNASTWAAITSEAGALVTQLVADASATLGKVGSVGNHPFTITTNNLNRIYIDTAGNVGLGNIDPVNKLDVEGSVIIGTSWAAGQTAPTNGLAVQGYLGVGTYNPGTQLVVENSTGSYQAEIKSTAGSWSGLKITNISTSLGLQAVNGGGMCIIDSNAALRFRTGNVDVAHLDTSGRFQIGSAYTSIIHTSNYISVNSNSEWPIGIRSNSATNTHRNQFLISRSVNNSYLTSGTIIGGIAWGGKYSAGETVGYDGGAEINGITTEAWSSSKVCGTKLSFATTPNGGSSAATRMEIMHNGLLKLIPITDPGGTDENGQVRVDNVSYRLASNNASTTKWTRYTGVLDVMTSDINNFIASSWIKSTYINPLASDGTLVRFTAVVKGDINNASPMIYIGLLDAVENSYWLLQVSAPGAGLYQKYEGTITIASNGTYRACVTQDYINSTTQYSYFASGQMTQLNGIIQLGLYYVASGGSQHDLVQWVVEIA